jgi:hypothetical protein
MKNYGLSLETKEHQDRITLEHRKVTNNGLDKDSQSNIEADNESHHNGNEFNEENTRMTKKKIKHHSRAEQIIERHVPNGVQEAAEGDIDVDDKIEDDDEDLNDELRKS